MGLVVVLPAVAAAPPLPPGRAKGGKEQPAGPFEAVLVAAATAGASGEQVPTGVALAKALKAALAGNPTSGGVVPGGDRGTVIVTEAEGADGDDHGVVAEAAVIAAIAGVQPAEVGLPAPEAAPLPEGETILTVTPSLPVTAESIEAGTPSETLLPPPGSGEAMPTEATAMPATSVAVPVPPAPGVVVEPPGKTPPIIGSAPLATPSEAAGVPPKDTAVASGPSSVATAADTPVEALAGAEAVRTSASPETGPSRGADAAPATVVPLADDAPPIARKDVGASNDSLGETGGESVPPGEPDAGRVRPGPEPLAGEEQTRVVRTVGNAESRGEAPIPAAEERPHPVSAVGLATAAAAPGAQPAGPANGIPFREPVTPVPVAEQASRAIVESIAGDGGEVTFVLDPPELGEVTIRVVAEGERVKLIVRVDRPEVAHLFRQAEADLTALLAQRGLELSDLFVGNDRGNGQAPGHSQPDSQRNAGTDFAAILGGDAGLEQASVDRHNRIRAAYNPDGALVYRV